MIYLRDKNLLLITKAVWKLNFWQFNLWNISFKITLLKLNFCINSFSPEQRNCTTSLKLLINQELHRKASHDGMNLDICCSWQKKTKPTTQTQTQKNATKTHTKMQPNQNQNQQTRTKHYQNWTKTEGCTKKNISKNCSKICWWWKDKTSKVYIC